MKLEISKNVGENKVRLEYKASPSKPAKAPIYIIDKTKADEFIKKYNAQTENLQKMTFITTLLTTLAGAIISMKNLPIKNKILSTAFGVVVGVVSGVLASSLISYEKKNNLMNKYDVYKV